MMMITYGAMSAAASNDLTVTLTMNHSKALETSVLPVNGCWAPLTPNFGTHHVSTLKFCLFGFLRTVQLS